MVSEKWASMVDKMAQLHEMTVSSEKDVLDVLKYTEVRLRPLRGRGKGKKRATSDIKSAISVLEWVSYKSVQVIGSPYQCISKLKPKFRRN